MLLSKAFNAEQVSDPDWEDLAYFARLIPRVCHNINRSAVKMGKSRGPPGDNIFPTFEEDS